MSRFEPAKLGCPCGHELTVNAADSLHVTNLPEVREAIKQGTFHVFPCPSCGARVRLDKLLAYTDFDRSHWFAVFPDRARAQWSDAVAFAHQSFRETMEERSAPLVKSWVPRFRASMRAIFGLDSLRDKLLAFDAGLDDRTLEALKLDVVRWYDLPWQEGSQLWFERVDGEQLVFAWIRTADPSAPPQAVGAPLDAYRRLALDAATPERAPALFDSIAVDMRLVRGHGALETLGAP
ncbi:MAG TPA: CpXC domain-containing protein [Haliangium sp.]|nr:CpXC domain-containing protein [Haliangium sp.]